MPAADKTYLSFIKVAQKYIEPRLSKDRKHLKVRGRLEPTILVTFDDLGIKGGDLALIAESSYFKTYRGNFQGLLNKYLEETKPAPKTFDFLQRNECIINLKKTGPRDEFLIVNRETGELLDYDCEALTKQARIVLGKEFNTAILGMRSGFTEFNLRAPHGISEYEDPGIGPMVKFNTCRQAAWRKYEVTGLPPPFMIKFFDNLFVHEDQKRNVFTWTSHAIEKRAEIALCLFGGRGYGKSNFIEMIRHMIGRENTDKAPDGFFNSPFNDIFKGKAFIVFDEVECNSPEKVSKLRRNQNPFITIEGKNKKPEAIPMHASFAFMANGYHKKTIEPDERRDYIPDLEDAIKDNEILDQVFDFVIHKKVKDNVPFDQHLRNIVEYLNFNKNPDFSMTTPDKNTKAFWKCVIQTPPLPIKFAMEKILAEDGEFTYRELLKEWDSSKTASVMFSTFNELAAFALAYAPFGVQQVEVDMAKRVLKRISKKEIKELESDQWSF